MQVLVFGSLNIDRTFTLPHTLIPGETVLSSSYAVRAGGKGANQAAALSKAGVETYIAGTIGPDGIFIKEQLESYGVRTDFLCVDEGKYTGSATILLDDRGQNSIVLYGGGNRENDTGYIDEVFSHFNPGDWLVIQNETNNLLHIMHSAGERGMKICLNPSPFDSNLTSVLDCDYIDLLAVNEVEISQMLDREIREDNDVEDYRKLLVELSKDFPGVMILLTIGEKGALYCSPGGEIIYTPAVKVKAVDTTGAGDTFLGYFLASLIKGMDSGDAMKRATKASSIAVSHKGAMDSIPFSWEIVD